MRREVKDQVEGVEMVISSPCLNVRLQFCSLLSSEGGEAIIQACLYQRSPTHIENMTLKTFDTRCSYCDEMH